MYALGFAKTNMNGSIVECKWIWRATTSYTSPWHTVGQSNQECRKARFFKNKTEIFLVSVTHSILRFPIVQNRFEQRNKDKIVLF